MIANYIKIYFRTMSQRKVFSFINIIGMAIGLSCFTILSLFVIDENGFDSHNKNKDHIYRVLVHLKFNGIDQTNAKSCPPLGPTLKNEFPEVLNYARIGYTGQHNLRYNDKVFREGDIYKVDSTYFDLFTVNIAKGNVKGILSKPNTMIISESAAKKYFGDINPIGKRIISDDTTSFLITGVMSDFPRKSHFSCDFFVSMSTYSENNENEWLDGGYTTYLLLKKGIDINEFNTKLKIIVDKYVSPLANAMFGITLGDFAKAGNLYSYEIQPLSSIYLKSKTEYNVDTNTEWGNARVSSITYSYIFAAIGIFILIIAVFNFMNLTTAISESRSVEVGIRKTLGSYRSQLISQFLSESLITSFISVFVSLFFTYLFLPYFNKFINRDLSLNLFDNYYAIPAFILLACFVGLIAGSYPAFYLSSFQSNKILKGGEGVKSRKSRVRSILVVVQYAISISLIIGTIIIRNQLEFIQNKNLGFNKDALLTIDNGSVISKNLKSFSNELLKYPDVISSTASSLMFSSGIPGNGFIFDGMTGGEIIPAQTLDVDHEFIKTYQIGMLKGRYFSKEFNSDSNAVVINETMARNCAFYNPVGKLLYAMNNETREMIPYRIIGIVKDFNYESLYKSVRPLVLHLSAVRQAATLITLRISTKNIQNTINKVDKVWNNYSGQEKMNYSFLNENIARMYMAEQKIKDLTIIFSILAIIISCLGLFGLVLFVTEQKTKEIGIRKVLGASVFEIIFILSKEFTKWVLAANVIAWPIAYYFMRNWLNNFAYRTSIDWYIFIVSGLIALIIAIATLSVQVLRAALKNPITSLRYE